MQPYVGNDYWRLQSGFNSKELDANPRFFLAGVNIVLCIYVITPSAGII